ncbi:hypothetical protein JZX82_gp82 [Gordonia phage William]|uniref:Uncharacterized protein n=1 Tax=Gordonia phage William TaxID=2571253 RepID=A0A4Y6EEN7_9CAUD|nr:hypothetical protein JZX82_gp82 [Gordonia phage William]QDF17178.1 hypothetical protein SEA_WILLIAM_82 [Gordonia phage William]
MTNANKLRILDREVEVLCPKGTAPLFIPRRGAVRARTPSTPPTMLGWHTCKR